MHREQRRREIRNGVLIFSDDGIEEACISGLDGAQGAYFLQDAGAVDVGVGDFVESGGVDDTAEFLLVAAVAEEGGVEEGGGEVVDECLGCGVDVGEGGG